MLEPKPYRGIIENWRRSPVDEGGYVIIGWFLNHPTLGKHGGESKTSLVVNENDSQVETLNSRYTLGWVQLHSKEQELH
jgi:hypothetical protein